MYNYVPGDSIRNLLIPQLEVTIRPLKGHVFTIPKRSPAELPGNPVLTTLLILALIYIHLPLVHAARESPRVSEPRVGDVNNDFWMAWIGLASLVFFFKRFYMNPMGMKKKGEKNMFCCHFFPSA